MSPRSQKLDWPPLPVVLSRRLREETNTYRRQTVPLDRCLSLMLGMNFTMGAELQLNATECSKTMGRSLFCPSPTNSCAVSLCSSSSPKQSLGKSEIGRASCRERVY